MHTHTHARTRTQATSAAWPRRCTPRSSCTRTSSRSCAAARRRVRVWACVHVCRACLCVHICVRTCACVWNRGRSRANASSRTSNAQQHDYTPPPPPLTLPSGRRAALLHQLLLPRRRRLCALLHAHALVGGGVVRRRRAAHGAQVRSWAAARGGGGGGGVPARKLLRIPLVCMNISLSPLCEAVSHRNKTREERTARTHNQAHTECP